MRINQWMIYGAYGYTGRLLAAAAKARGLTPVLAGRDADKLKAVAAPLELETRAFELDDAAVAQQLKGVGLLLNAAGPFSATAAPALAGCLEAGCHYLDITGEIEVFEHVHGQDSALRRGGIVACPGVGFDVIPTDCMAAALKQALPDAIALSLGFFSRSDLSPGTAKTAVEGLGMGGRVRRNGQIVPVPLAYHSREIDFGEGPRLAITIPWGDVSTAYYTTGIANIDTYLPVPPAQLRLMKLLRHLQPLLRTRWIQQAVKGAIGRRIIGPDEQARANSPTWIWGEARNGAGSVRRGRLRTGNGYDVTVHGALGVVEKLLSQPHPPGAYTPAQLMGQGYITTLPGSGDFLID
jgi:short subunit dehydrogenase-like uncharacterized protein